MAMQEQRRWRWFTTCVTSSCCATRRSVVGLPCARCFFSSSVQVERWSTDSHRRWIQLGLFAHSFVVHGPSIHVHDVCVGLRRAVWIGVVQHLLYAHEDLFHGDGRFPIFVFVDDAQAHGTRRIHVGMEEAGWKLGLGRFAWIRIAELQRDGIESTFPIRAFLARYVAFPTHEIHGSVRKGLGSCEEPVRMVLAPRLPLFRQPATCDPRHRHRTQRRNVVVVVAPITPPPSTSFHHTRPWPQPSIHPGKSTPLHL